MDEILKRLRSTAAVPAVMVGFDGYVDSIFRVCRQTGEAGTSFFETMAEIGGYIAEKAKKSCSLELQLQTIKLGGNMPIFSQAIAGLGASVNCIGALGSPEILPLFQQMHPNCVLTGVSNPGLCQALEFDDGKVMLARNEGIGSLDYERLTARLSAGRLREMAEQSSVIAFLNWSELQGSSSIWKGFLREILPGISRRKLLFLDLSDCSQRPVEEVREAAGLISEFAAFIQPVLSLNQNEAEVLTRSIGLPVSDSEAMALRLREALSCSLVVIHHLDGACCAGAEGCFRCANKRIEKPRLSTGGGDNFNAGFVLALLLGLTPGQALFTANAVSGYYVSQGKSPDREELIGWMEAYGTEIIPGEFYRPEQKKG